MAQKKPKVGSELTLDAGNGAAFKKRWMDLLASLQQEGSITSAAKAVGLSYKAAWDAIATMNNLAGHVLVERSVGGKGGGGARLTARGLRLVETFRAVEAENTRFVERVNRRVGNADLQSLGRMTMLTSARNHFVGRITRITRGAVNDEVELKLPGGAKIVAIITHESTDLLGLKKGVEAIALIKASWIIVATEDADAPMKLSARNQLRGIVSNLSPGAVNTEVLIELKGGQTVAAIITKASAESLGLAPGKPATAIFKASSVILGIAG